MLRSVLDGERKNHCHKATDLITTKLKLGVELIGMLDIDDLLFSRRHFIQHYANYTRWNSTFVDRALNY